MSADPELDAPAAWFGCALVIAAIVVGFAIGAIAARFFWPL